MSAMRAGATDPSCGRQLCRPVPLHLSNGVCGIFLLSPLCCRKREVREPQAPAPVLQVTQPFSPPPRPQNPSLASRCDRSPGPCPGWCWHGRCWHIVQGGHRRRGIASSPARGFGSATWGPHMCGRVGGGCPRRGPQAAERGRSTAGGLLGGSHHGHAGLGWAWLGGSILHRCCAGKSPLASPKGSTRKPASRSAAPSIKRSIIKWYRRQQFTPPPPPPFYRLK